MTTTPDAAPVLRLERDGEVRVAVLCNAAKLNPLGLPLQQQLRDLLASVHDDRSIRALLLTGEGKGFCVGADLSAMRPPRTCSGTNSPTKPSASACCSTCRASPKA